MRQRALLASCLSAVGRAIDERCDLVEGEVEHVVEDGGEPFGGSPGLEHDEEGETDRVGKQAAPVSRKKSVGEATVLSCGSSENSYIRYSAPQRTYVCFQC
jgi:hypothetical protein